MEFRTKIKVDGLDPKLMYGDQIMSIGSCFAENIGRKLLDIKMNAEVNPIGILYNPHSISLVIEGICSSQFSIDPYLVFHDQLWHSFLHHGTFSHPDRDIVIKRIYEAHDLTFNSLQNAKWLILTFGTSHVYEHIERNYIVGNCHKVTNHAFKRRRLTVQECINSIQRLISSIRKVNPDISVLCTVSPIRHIRDGFVENQKSKSTLIVALDEICKAHKRIHYFPSYEIVMDDLRDYRFYENDLIHPNQQAMEYIWQLFSDSLLEEETKRLSAFITKLHLAAKHRPIYHNPTQIKVFANNQIEKIAHLKEMLPMVNFDIEEKHFKSLVELG